MKSHKVIKYQWEYIPGMINFSYTQEKWNFSIKMKRAVWGGCGGEGKKFRDEWRFMKGCFTISDFFSQMALKVTWKKFFEKWILLEV